MPPPSPGKYRGPAIRQLSLQNLTPLQSPTTRGLKKQLSEDSGRVLESVEVTGHGWNVGSERVQLRVNSGSGKMGQGKVLGARPKPVKVAWADRKPENPENSGVEVIATKCQGQPRPMSLKTQRLRSPLLGNKDTLVYSRLQLAERLRNAWSEREKIKPNINIFLARAPDTTRSENDGAGGDAPGGAVVPQDGASALSDPSAPLDKKRKSMRVRAFTREFSHSDVKTVSDPPEEADLKEMKESSPRNEGSEFPARHLQDLNKIEIRITKVEGEAEGRENKPPDPEEASVGGKRCRDKDSESSSDGKPESKAAESPPVTAQDRRANFRRSSMLNKTITESFSSGVEEKDSRVVTKIPQRKPPLIRAFSAPSQNDQTSIASLQKKVKTAPQRRLQPTVSFDIPSTDSDNARSSKDRIKSAPVRRKLKSAAARRKGKDKDSSDEEKETKDSGAATKKATFRRSQLKKGGDIVTMVSLVSPAESDTEDSVINLPMESWTGEERAEAPPEEKTSAGPEESRESSLPVQKFVSLRKTTKSGGGAPPIIPKGDPHFDPQALIGHLCLVACPPSTVTFHPHPILSRSYSVNFPSRRAPPGTPIIVPTPVISNPALTPAQLLERDKRTPPLSVNCSALDGRGIKRKLLRSSSESTKDDDTSDDKGTEELSENLEGREAGEEQDEKANGEPDFKCPKERECWNLYQKMVQKGVSVSFDTVLRGMLTPTEYRLRKNHLLLNC